MNPSSAARQHTCPPTAFRHAPARLLPDELPLVVAVEPQQPALDDGGEKGDNFLAVMRRGDLLLPENIYTRNLQVPDSRLDAKFLEAFEENWVGGLLPEMREVILYSRSRE
jgi:hypothetical protein